MLPLEVRPKAKPSAAPACSLYPNPASGLVRVQVSPSWSKPLLAEVVDAHGNIRFTGRFFKSSFELDVSGLPRGVYLLRVRNAYGSGLAVEKLVRQ